MSKKLSVKQKIIRRIRNLARSYWVNKVYWTPRRFYISLDDVKINKPVFLLGTQGGGLTLIARVLSRHPDVVTVEGNNKNWAGHDEMHNLYVDLPDELALRSPGFWAYQHYHFMAKDDHPEFGFERSWVYATDSLLADYRKTEANWTPEIEMTLTETIKKCLRSYAYNFETARFLDKSQTYTLKIPLLRKCLTNPKFVLILRNPYVMCWREVTQRTNKYRHFKQQLTMNQALDLACQHWSNTYRIALSDLKTDEGLLLRFEDFLLKPQLVLEKLLNYTELTFCDNLLPKSTHRLPLGSGDLSKWYPLRTNVNDRYLAGITPEASRIIYEAVGDIAEQFGYNCPY